MGNMNRSIALALAVVAFLSCGAASAVGRFAYVDGSVSVRDGTGGIRTARSGERINEGDTITTSDGRAQIRFDDRGWVSLQPRTVFEVKEYSESAGNAAMSLLKGSLRAVTGLIGNRNPDRYRVETAVATIGIRGTSFQATFCTQSCNAPDGLYVTGGDGTTFVRNGFGEIDLSRGRTAHVASGQTPPRESNVKPVADVPPPVSSQQMASAGSTNPGELRPGNFLYSQGITTQTPQQPTVPPLTITQVTSAGGGGAASGTGSATLTVIVRGTRELFPNSVTDFGIAAGAGATTAGQQVFLATDALQRPVSITASDNLGNRLSVTALTPQELAFNDGVLYWGRWTNAQFMVDGQLPGQNSSAFGTANVPAGSYLHYIFGIPAATVPVTGTATYSLIGSTGSTSVAGSVGAGLTGGTLTANFLLNRVTANNLAISHGGTFTAGGTAFLDSGNRAQFASVAGTATGPGGTFPFKFEGFFAGAPAPSAPARAGVVFAIERPDAIVGTGAFRCSNNC